MKPKDVVKHFGGIVQTAEALGVTRQAVYMWLDRKKIPYQRACQIEINTRGALKASP